MFLSLAKVIATRETKNSSLVEIPGSVESEVRSIFKKMSSRFPGSRAALVYPDNVLGKSYINTFWELSSLYGIKIVDAVSFDPSKKDLRDPIKDLLGLRYKRERKEELEILNEVYSLEKSVIRRVQKLKPLIDFDWVFVPSAPYNAAQIIPSFSYFDATKQILLGPSSWRSTVVKEVSKGKKGVNFNLSKALDLSHINKFVNAYGYSPKLPEARGIDSIRFLSQILDGRELSSIKSREEYVNSLLATDEIDLSNSILRLLMGLGFLTLKLGTLEGIKLFLN